MLKHNNVQLIRYNSSRRLCDALLSGGSYTLSLFKSRLKTERVCMNPRTLSGRLFQSLGAKYEKVLPPLVDFAILGTTRSMWTFWIKLSFDCVQI